MAEEAVQDGQWQAFSQDNSMHGIRYLTMKNQTKCRKVLWGIAMCLCLGYFMASLGLFLNDFTRRLVSTKVKIKSAQKLTFPTVTICNRNMWKRSAAQAFFAQVPTMSEHIEKVLIDIYRDGELPPPPDRYNWSDPTLKVMLEGNEQVEMIKVLELLAYTVDETFLRCYVKGALTSCNETVERVRSDGGICFRFNQLGDFEAHSAGTSGGVYFLLDARVDEYYIGRHTFAEGFMVALHDKDEVPLMEELSFGVSPGFETIIDVQMTKIQREPPYADGGESNCFDADKLRNPLHFHKKYSHSACVHECRVSFVINRCNCTDTFDPPLNGTKTCDVKKALECSTPASREFPTKHEYLQACNCRPKCNEVWYSPKLSINRLAGTISANYEVLSPEQQAYTRENIAGLKLVFGKLTYQHLEETVVYSCWDLLANIGGTLGVCLGASVLTLLEFTEFAARYLSQRLFKRKKPTPVKELK